MTSALRVALLPILLKNITDRLRRIWMKGEGFPNQLTSFMHDPLHAKRRHENTDVHMLSSQTFPRSLRCELMGPQHARKHALSSTMLFKLIRGLFCRRGMLLGGAHSFFLSSINRGQKNIPSLPFSPSLISSNGFGFRASLV